MADDKRSRDKQARDTEERQRERELAEALERADEPEPPIAAAELTGLEADLEDVSFPATGADIVDAVADRRIESSERSYTAGELLADTDAETFEDPAAVRERIQRPTVAGAMKRILEETETLQNEPLDGSRRDAYERTLAELEAIDAVDDDEGIAVVTDWIVDRIREKGKLPGSRAVRREAAKVCRASGYEVRNDEWLGV
jgi:hypothetical protein